MPQKYTVEKTLAQDDTLGNATGKDIEIRVTDNDATGTIGRLRLSRSGVDWFSGAAHKKHDRVAWKDLIAFITKEGKPGQD